jgi:uncharacterized C2H2 Zn-finger protein
MEAEEYDQLVAGKWPAWNDDSFNENEWNNNPDTFDDSCITGHLDSFPLMPDFLDPSQFLTPGPQTDGSALGSMLEFPDYVPQLDHPRFEPTLMMDVISPLSSGGTTWTSPSIEFDFNSPIIDTTWPQSVTTQPDKLTWMGEDWSSNEMVIAPMDTVRQPPPQSIPGVNPLDGARRPSPQPALGANPLDGVQQPPLQSAMGFELLTLKDRPPHIDTREWRKQIRPERCPVCRKGHTQRSELKKHILVHHPELTAEYGISTERHVCKWCGSDYKRADHLTRHLNKEHGRVKNAKRRSRGKRRDETGTRS